MPDTPSRNDDRTIACPICGHGFRPSGRRRFCSDACRQAAWRARQPVAPVAPGPPRSPRPVTVYACPACLRSVPSKSVTARSLRDEGLEQAVLF
jgi:endogenous inhibitor of DNA gyrase (YacG/DUF329 family)